MLLVLEVKAISDLIPTSKKKAQKLTILNNQKEDLLRMHSHINHRVRNLIVASILRTNMKLMK